jgi:hypothetical protein
MLASEAASFPKPNGLNGPFVWYCTSRFFYLSASKFHNIDFTLFQIVLDKYNKDCLR